MKTKYYLTIFLVLAAFFLAPSTIYAAICGKCGHYELKYSSYTCEECGNYVIVTRSHNIYWNPRPLPTKPSLSPSQMRQIRWMKQTRGKPTAAIGLLLIGLGSALFVGHTWWMWVLGIILILFGLGCAYAFFEANSMKKGTDKETQMPSSSGANPEFKHNSLRPSRISSSPSDTPPSAPLEKTHCNTSASSPTTSPEIRQNSLRPSRISSLSSDTHPTATSAKTHCNTSVVNNNTNGSYFYDEGVLYCNGNDGRSIDYTKAIECFRKAQSLGCKKAESWLIHLTGKNTGMEK